MKNSARLCASSLLVAMSLTGCFSGKAPETVSGSPASASGGKIVFREVAKEAGLDYVWRIPNKSAGNILDLIGNGCAFLDYDNDGNLDILLVGPKPALFRGDGKGKFTPAPFPPLSGHFLGCATGDFNRDGFVDIYLTAYRGGVLLQNEAGKGFRDVTKTSGIPPQPWGSAASFADLDGDGNLDLYIGNYAKFGPETVPQLCRQKGIETACGPRQYPPEPGFLYRGDGKGRFTDITKISGFNKLTGKALGVAIADYDGTGHLSVAVANDEMPGDLMKWRAKGKFENIAKIAGTATDTDGNVHGGMGIDWGDIDGSGKLDLFVATYQNEIKNLYRNDGDDLFTDKAAALGLISAAPMVAFGAKFADFDNDGVLDLVIANGHVLNNIAQIDARTTFLQPTLFFRGTGGGAFVPLNETLAAAVTKPLMGRGLAIGDYDNDGKPDVLIVDSNGAPLLLHNETKESGNFLGVALSDPSGASPLGADVRLTVGGRTLMRHCHTDGSYMSASDPRILFGLGATEKAGRLTVSWPGGGTETWENLPVDRYHRLTKGAGAN